MTDAEKDAAWRSLPENIRREIRKGYNKLKYYWHITADRRNGAMASYENIFGKHNLTASEEEKPRFKVGDLVLVKKEFDFGSNFGLAYVFCITPHPIKEIADGKAVLQNDWGRSPNSEYAMVPLDSLILYTEEQEPKNDEHVDFSSSSLQNRKNLTENDILSVPKETAEDLSNLMAEVNNFIEKNQASHIDWLAYRMELAKVVVNGLLFTGKSPETIADEATAIVDGIVERLKGGDK